MRQGADMNLNIDLNIMTIQYFVTVADTGNMTRAANKLFLTQPTLSRQIAALEQTLGVTLFNRTKGGVELTDRGQAFYSECKELLEAYNRFSSKAFEFKDMTVGTLVVGHSKHSEVQTININYGFYQIYPNVNVQSHSVAGHGYYEELSSHISDCIFIYEGELDPSDKDIERMPVESLEYRLLVPRQNPLSERDSIRLEELAGQKFIFPDKMIYAQKYQHMLDIFQAHGIVPEIADTAIYYLDYVMRCVHHNALYLSPYIPTIGEYPQVKYLVIEDFDETYDIDLIWMKNNKNPILPLYTKFVRDEMDRQARQMEAEDLQAGE